MNGSRYIEGIIRKLCYLVKGHDLVVIGLWVFTQKLTVVSRILIILIPQVVGSRIVSFVDVIIEFLNYSLSLVGLTLVRKCSDQRINKYPTENKNYKEYSNEDWP